MSENFALPGALKDFLNDVRMRFRDASLHKVVLSRYHGADAELDRLMIKPVLIQQDTLLSLVYRYKTNDITVNQGLDEFLNTLEELLRGSFRQANLFFEGGEIQLSISKKGKYLYRAMRAPVKAISEGSMAHDREKFRFLSLDRPFLVELGVTDKQHRLVPAMARKWKQINKFIEIVAAAIGDLERDGNQPLKVADFGSGKAYLTFALHDYLSNSLTLTTSVVGVELRPNLVDACNQTVEKLNLKGIGFAQGDVQHFAQESIDVMIALHACDVATDFAIHRGIRANAQVIVCSPCCHKQIRPQMKLPSVLAPMLQHGIHLGQEAEMVTDSLRALLLEANGYDTKVFEFVSLEHTSKNKMILATKRKRARDDSEILAQIDSIKQFYGISEHCLESLLSSQ